MTPHEKRGYALQILANPLFTGVLKKALEDQSSIWAGTLSGETEKREEAYYLHRAFSQIIRTIEAASKEVPKPKESDER